MGEYMMPTTANANREFLVETCRGTGAILANTCFDHPREHLATYYAPAPGVGPKSAIAITDSAQWDY
eukprot:1469786-Pyramimonas_sp.AAC.1